MKKTKIILSTLLLVALFMGCNKKAEAEENSGAETTAEKSAKNLKPNPERDFEFTKNDSLTGVVVTRYKGKSSKIIIPETIQGLPVIGIEFSDDSDLYNATLVVFPGTVKYIARARDIGAKLKEGEYADVVFSEGLVAIYNMSSSRSYKTNLYAKISSLKFPSTLKYIANNAFWGVKTKTVVLPESLELIGAGAFNYSTMESLTLPAVKGKLFISGINPFIGCDPISQINIPENIAEHYRLCNQIEYDARYDSAKILNESEFIKGTNSDEPVYGFHEPGTISLGLGGIFGPDHSVELQEKLNNIKFPYASEAETKAFLENTRETLKTLDPASQEYVYKSLIRKLFPPKKNYLN